MKFTIQVTYQEFLSFWKVRSTIRDSKHNFESGQQTHPKPLEKGLDYDEIVDEVTPK